MGGTYAADAQALIEAPENTAIATCGDAGVVKPGDNFGGCTETNPSYVAPAYYRVFEGITGKAAWSNLLDSGYALLAANQAPKGGVPTAAPSARSCRTACFGAALPSAR